MSKRLRVGVWLAIGAFASAVIVGLATVMSGGRRPSGPLPDGSVLTLEAVTYGSRHQHVEGSRWQQVLYPVLPASIRQGLRVNSVVPASAQTLVFWIRRRAAVPGQALAQPFWQARAEAVDEQGHTAETGYLSFRSDPPDGPATEMLEAWSLPVFPRRGATVRLRFYTPDGRGRWMPAAEFRVPNPTPGPHPTWRPEPLPVTKRDGDLAVTLTSFEVATRSRTPLREGDETWTHSTFRFEQDGHPDAAWETAGFTLTDATGNLCQRTQALFHTRLPGGERFSFRGALWPQESAWKLRMRFARTAGFAPTELWTLRDLPVPGLRATRRMSQSVSLQGVTLSLLSVSGRAAPASDWRDPSLQVRMSPMTQKRQMTLVRALDDRGRECMPAYATLMPGGFLTYGLPGATDAKRITVTFAVQKPRVVEFLVSPSRAR